MFLKAGALSLALLLASRLLGLVREAAQAAAFGSSGMADVAVLMISLPDWLAGVMASGALAYVLLPAWAAQGPLQRAQSQRRVAAWLIGLGAVLAVALTLLRWPALAWLAPGMPPGLYASATYGLVWSALAVPTALLAALWTTRLQYENNFTGMYAANLVVNLALVAAILAAGRVAPLSAPVVLGLGLLAAMLARLAWLRWRMRPPGEPIAATATTAASAPLPPLAIWVWASLSAGLPLALPFVARSIASQQGEGALAVFNYAWKLVELPLILAVQLVATLAFPRIARVLASGDGGGAAAAVRAAFALSWTLACAAAAALLVGAPALSQLLFGWGRMDAPALGRIAAWGAVGAWGLPAQALIAVSLTVLAARSRMRRAVLGYAVALAALLAAGSTGLSDGGQLMLLLNSLLAAVAVICAMAMGNEWRAWMPWRALVTPALLLLCAAIVGRADVVAGANLPLGLAAAALSAAIVTAGAWVASGDVRVALQR